MSKKKEQPQQKYYFVDEAGDGNLFAHRGRVLLGQEGCSRFFMLGLLDIADPKTLGDELEKLRKGLLADTYFKNVPSMQPEQRKTALMFHAKDDVPEVRREVYHLLQKTAGLRFFAVVTDKQRVLEYVQRRNALEPTYHYNPNELYDYLVRRLFKERLHKDDGYNVIFSERGKSDRTKALKKALLVARERFLNQWGKTSTAPIQVCAAPPIGNAGLQAVDYFLWAVQRVYEHQEDRYCNLLAGSIKLIHDIDDTHQARYGVYYTEKSPITADAIKRRQ